MEDARAFLDATLTNLATSIVVIDSKKRIKLYNKSAEKLLNFRSSNMIGENLMSAIKDIEKFDGVIKFIDEAQERKNKLLAISQEINFGSENEEKTLILKLSAKE